MDKLETDYKRVIRMLRALYKYIKYLLIFVIFKVPSNPGMLYDSRK